jgi:hypothetical protein
MTPEIDFIRKLEAYLDYKFSDYGKKRVQCLLRDYGAHTPKIKKIQSQIIGLPENLKKPISEDSLLIEAQRICEVYGVQISEFMSSKNGKSTTVVADARKTFCNHVLGNYIINKQKLKSFFSVDHTTISYYIHGKKYKPTTANREN